MSGPKVVKIVSREEYQRLEAQRDKLLAGLQKEINRWKDELSALGEFSEEKLFTLENDLAELRKSFFPNFDKSVMRAGSLRERLEKEIKEAHIAQRARALERRRRVSLSAKELASQMQNAGLASPVNLCSIAKDAMKATDEEVATFETALNDAVATFLKSSPADTPVEEQSLFLKELSAGLGEIKKLKPFQDETNREQSDKNGRLDRLIAEAELLGSNEDAKSFISRAQAISAEHSGPRRELLTDSLILDLSNYCRQTEDVQRARRLLSESKETLVEFDPTRFSELNSRLEVALKNSVNLDSANVLAKEVKDAINQAHSSELSASKRKIILEGFAKLGYEVREGMETLWAKNNRLVLSKKTSADIGIEIASGQSLERIQMRAVLLQNSGKEQGLRTDLPLETAWCGELDQLRKSLKQDGLQLEIEVAQAAGKVPVKICKPMSWTGDEEVEVENTASKQLRSREL